MKTLFLKNISKEPIKFGRGIPVIEPGRVVAVPFSSQLPGMKILCDQKILKEVRDLAGNYLKKDDTAFSTAVVSQVTSSHDGITTGNPGAQANNEIKEAPTGQESGDNDIIPEEGEEL